MVAKQFENHPKQNLCCLIQALILYANSIDVVSKTLVFEKTKGLDNV